MALTDTVMKMVTRQPKDGKEVPVTDRERMIKSKAGLVINVLGYSNLVGFNWVIFGCV